MRTEPIVALAWGLLLGVLLALQFLFPTDMPSWELTAGAAGATLLLALGLYRYRRRPAAPDEVPAAETSYSTVAAAAGAAVAIMGSAFGAWLYLPGLGLFVLGLVGVVLELVGERGARR